MQGVDYGKITPLLTAALQEALAKIENSILLRIDSAFAAAKNDPFPTLNDTLIDVYAGDGND